MILDKIIENLNKEVNKTNIGSNSLLKLLEERKFFPTKYVEKMAFLTSVMVETLPDHEWSISFVKKRNIVHFRNDNNNIIYAINNPIQRILNIEMCFDLYFPIIKIVNSDNEHTILKDLYVRLKFTNNDEIKIQGTRGTMSLAEYSSKYYHSHLTTNTPYGEYSTFCLGNSEILSLIAFLKDDLNEYVSKLNTNQPDISEVENKIRIGFKHCLFQIEPYISWESIEGVPFVRMNNIFIRNTLNNGLNPLSYDQCELVFKMLLPYIFKHQLPIKIVGNNLILADDERMEAILTEAFSHIRERIEPYYAVRKSTAGTYYPYDVEYQLKSVPEAYIYFNGEQRKFHIDVNATDLNTTNYYLHPKIKNHVINKFKHILIQSSIEKNIVRKLQNPG